MENEEQPKEIKRGRGRPKGSKGKKKEEAEIVPEEIGTNI